VRDPLRWCAIGSATWLGLLLAVAALATPVAFTALPAAEAGKVVARVLSREAALSLGFGAALSLLLRVAARRGADMGGGVRMFPVELVLALGALFCTVAGYYGIQPWMAEARAGNGRFSFGQLHAASAAFYGVKVLLVGALAWRCAAPRITPTPSSSS
jgi:hypothetical protein